MSQLPPRAPFAQPQPPTKPNTTKTVLLVLAIVFGVSIVVCAGLTAALLPALQKARTAAKRVVEQSNLRMIGVSIMLYEADSNGRLPRHVAQTHKYLPDDKPYISPFNEGGSVGRWIDEGGSKAIYRYGDYFFAHAYEQDADASPVRQIELAKLASPSELFVAFSAKVSSDQRGRTVLFLDGHTEWLEDADFAERLADQNGIRERDGLPIIDMAEVAKLE